jgi:hypothetical protein
MKAKGPITVAAAAMLSLSIDGAAFAQCPPDCEIHAGFEGGSGGGIVLTWRDGITQVRPILFSMDLFDQRFEAGPLGFTNSVRVEFTPVTFTFEHGQLEDVSLREVRIDLVATQAATSPHLNGLSFGVGLSERASYDLLELRPEQPIHQLHFQYGNAHRHLHADPRTTKLRPARHWLGRPGVDLPSLRANLSAPAEPFILPSGLTHTELAACRILDLDRV